jgi:hypothetical protein
MLKPQPARTLAIGPRRTLVAIDAAPIAAPAGYNLLNWYANLITPGALPPPATGTAIVYEVASFTLIASDASADLVVTNAQINMPILGSVPARSLVILPYTFPPTVGALGYTVSTTDMWVDIVVGTPTAGELGGPIVYMEVNNKDAVAHTYTRYMSLTYRVIENVDPTSGPGVPGAGLSPEFRYAI